MPSLVCTGAKLQCSFGTAPATFTASAARVSARAAAGVVTDTGTASVPAFGQCTSLSNPQVNAATQAASGTLTPQPCQPVVPGNWTPGSAQVTAGTAAALDSASQCRCTWNGVITVTDAGQANVTLQ
jgi:hypothetical protein